MLPAMPHQMLAAASVTLLIAWNLAGVRSCNRRCPETQSWAIFGSLPHLRQNCRVQTP